MLDLFLQRIPHTTPAGRGPSFREFFVSLGLIWLLAPEASARLGESVEQCIARYETVAQRPPATIPESDAEALFCKKNDITVLIHFKSGKAWHITYGHEKLPLSSVDTLLRANNEQAAWSSTDGYTRNDRRFWTTADGKKSAVLYSLKQLRVLECMTTECRKVFADQRHQRIRQAQREIVSDKHIQKAAAAATSAAAEKATQKAEEKKAPLIPEKLQGF